MMKSSFHPPARKYVPINPSLQCGEEDEDETFDFDDEDEKEDFRGPIRFHIQLPLSSSSSDDASFSPMQRTQRLYFNCHDTSSGVLLPSEQPKPQQQQQSTGREISNVCDPFFFEKGFYLEAKTGFQVWPGSRLMVEAFLPSTSSTTTTTSSCCCDNERHDEGAVGVITGMRRYCKEQLLSHGGGNNINNYNFNKLNVLEVGAGIGLVGTCLAALGDNVLITDLPVLVKHAIRPNLRRNGRRRRSIRDVISGGNGSSGRECELQQQQQQCSKFLDDASIDASSSFFDAVPIGKGWARPAILDWFQPVEEQISKSTLSNIDVIIACDCMFLRKLVDPLLNTIATIFNHSTANNGKNPSFFFTFQRRNMLGLFIQIEELLSRIKGRGWTVECVAWRNVEVEGDGIHENYLFRVTPTSRSESLSSCDFNDGMTLNDAPFVEEKKE